MIRVQVLPPIGVNVNVTQKTPANVKASGNAINLGGVKDYGRLSNKPTINEHELRAGENTLEEIGIGLASALDVINLFK